jgi:hypothetical protein
MRFHKSIFNNSKFYKMKNFMTLVALMLLPLCSNAQDVIIKNDDSEITAKVMQLSADAVQYQVANDPQTYLIPNADLLMVRLDNIANVRYKSGKPTQDISLINKLLVARKSASNTQVVVQQQPIQQVVQQPVQQPVQQVVQQQPTSAQPQIVYVQVPASPPVVTATENYCDKGTSDSKIYYTGAGSGAGGVGILTALNPILGLITTAIVAGSKPSAENLKMPPTLGRNSEYAACYTNQAVVTKKAKVWRGCSVGSLIFLGVVLIAASSQSE